MTRTTPITLTIITLGLGLSGGCSLLEDPNAQESWEAVAVYPSPLADPAYRPVEEALARMFVDKNIRYRFSFRSASAT